MKTLALTSPAGEVAIMRLVREDLQDKAIRDFAAVSFSPVSVVEIAENDVPNDRTFRNAWGLAGNRISVRMDKAREIQRDQLRRDRVPLLAALDVEWSRAMAKGDATAAQEIEARRQALRDLPADPAIDAAQTPAALKAIRAQDRLSK